MIERICPIHNVPVSGTKCSKDGCTEKPITSVTIYWCKHCDIPVFDKKCKLCNGICDYIATDLRPVFPEEKVLLSILLQKKTPLALENCSVWNSNSGYIVDGEKITLSITGINRYSLEEVAEIRTKYESYKNRVDYTLFEAIINKFIEANTDRYHEIVDEAITYIQSFSLNY